MYKKLQKSCLEKLQLICFIAIESNIMFSLNNDKKEPHIKTFHPNKAAYLLALEYMSNWKLQPKQTTASALPSWNFKGLLLP